MGDSPAPAPGLISNPLPAAAFLLAVLIAVLLPTLLVEIPAMVDYPNHLARMSILLRDGGASAHPYYRVAWAPYPNLAMDLAVPALARWAGVEGATKVFLLLSQLLIVGGACALSLAVRRRFLGAGLAACLLLYAMPFAFGFLNFQFALGLALLALAAWIALSSKARGKRLAVHVVATVLLFFSHLFALGLYGFAIGIVELWRWRQAWPGMRTASLTVLGMAAPVLLVSLLAYREGGSVGGSGTQWYLGAKFFWLGILNGWSREVAVILGTVVLIPAVLAARRGWLRLVGPGAWLAGGFLLLFLALPFRLFDTGFVDGRALIAGLLILPAFTAVTLPTARMRKGALAALAAACLADAAHAGWLQHGYAREYRTLLAALATMPAGARLLPADRLDADDPPANLADYPMYHAATLAVHTRDAFVPTLFASPGKQPLRIMPDMARLAVLEGGPIPWRLLSVYATGTAPPARLGYVAQWTRDFDYVLMLNPEAAPPRPDILEQIAQGSRFALYRVTSAIPATRP